MSLDLLPKKLYLNKISSVNGLHPFLPVTSALITIPNAIYMSSTEG